MNNDPKDFGKELIGKYPKEGASPLVYDVSFDILLTDFVLLFVASNIARCRPQMWEQILAETDKDEAVFNTIIKTIYGRVFHNESKHYETFHYQLWTEFYSLDR
jgi:hypothetical protein